LTHRWEFIFEVKGAWRVTNTLDRTSTAIIHVR
jgi:hypothetical protein